MTAGWLLRRTIRRLGRRKLAFVGLSLAFASLAALGAGARTLAEGSRAATARLTDEAHVIAYLEDGMSVERTQSLAGAFSRLPSVQRVRQVDGRGALLHLQRELRSMGADGNLIEGVEADFLPTSLEVVLAPGPDLAWRAADVALRLRRLPGVASVDAMTVGLARLAGFETLARRLAGLLAGATFLIAIALCAAVIGRERGRQREEAEALALVGVQATAVRVPAGLVGMLAAVVGGLVGLLVGGPLAIAVFGAALQPPALPGNELLLGLGLLAIVGVAVGCLSVPGRRLVNAA